MHQCLACVRHGATANPAVAGCAAASGIAAKTCKDIVDAVATFGHLMSTQDPHILYPGKAGSTPHNQAQQCSRSLGSVLTDEFFSGSTCRTPGDVTDEARVQRCSLRSKLRGYYTTLYLSSWPATSTLNSPFPHEPGSLVISLRTCGRNCVSEWSMIGYYQYSLVISETVRKLQCIGRWLKSSWYRRE